MKTRSDAIIIDYPLSFPCPTPDGYAVGYDHGTVETEMQSGWTRRRRLDPRTYRTVQLSFEMKVDVFQAFHQYIHRNGFHWIRMPLQTNTTQTGQHKSLEILRCTSGISYSYVDFGRVRAAISAELWVDPDTADIPSAPSGVTVNWDGGGVDSPAGDRSAASDPGNTIDMNNPPRQTVLQLTSETAIPFRTQANLGDKGVFILSAQSDVRAWISDSSGGAPVGLMASVTGSLATLNYVQDRVVGTMTVLSPDTRYFLNIKPMSGDSPEVEVGAFNQ